MMKKSTLYNLTFALMGIVMTLTATLADDGYAKRMHNIYPVAVDTPTQSYKQYDEPKVVKGHDSPAIAVAPVVTKIVAAKPLVVKRVVVRTKDGWARDQISRLWGVVGGGKKSAAPKNSSISSVDVKRALNDALKPVYDDSLLDNEGKVIVDPGQNMRARFERVEKNAYNADKAAKAAAAKADKVGHWLAILALLVGLTLFIALFRETLADRAETIADRVRARRAATPAGP